MGHLATMNGVTVKTAPLPHLNQVHRALLFLDVQEGILGDPPTGIPAASTMRENLALVLKEARAANPKPLIIHVRNTGDVGEPDEPNAPGWQLVWKPLPDEPVIDKFKNNAFHGTRLGELIPARAEVVVVGMQSDFCVRATCSAALGRGNTVLMIRGAHATYDRVEVWNNMTVTPASEVEAEIEDELEEAGVVLFEMKDIAEIFGDR